MCIAAQLGAPTSGTAMFNRCLLSGTAGSFLSERFPWAMYIQPPKPMLSPSVRSYSDQLPTFQPSFSFLLWLEHTQKGEDTHTHKINKVSGQHFSQWQCIGPAFATVAKHLRWSPLNEGRKVCGLGVFSL